MTRTLSARQCRKRNILTARSFHLPRRNQPAGISEQDHFEVKFWIIPQRPVSTPEIAEKFPLIGGTGLKLGIFTHSQYRTLGWLNEIVPESYVEIHPQTAAELHIKDGERVKIETQRGSIEVAAKITEATDPRVAFITYGWGQPYAHGACANVLTDMMKRCPISGANGNRSFLCRIRKA